MLLPTTAVWRPSFPTFFWKTFDPVARKTTFSFVAKSHEFESHRGLIFSEKRRYRLSDVVDTAVVTVVVFIVVVAVDIDVENFFDVCCSVRFRNRFCLECVEFTKPSRTSRWSLKSKRKKAWLTFLSSKVTNKQDLWHSSQIAGYKVNLLSLAIKCRLEIVIWL